MRRALNARNVLEQHRAALGQRNRGGAQVRGGAGVAAHGQRDFGASNVHEACCGHHVARGHGAFHRAGAQAFGGHGSHIQHDLHLLVAHAVQRHALHARHLEQIVAHFAGVVAQFTGLVVGAGQAQGEHGHAAKLVIHQRAQRASRQLRLQLVHAGAQALPHLGQAVGRHGGIQLHIGECKARAHRGFHALDLGQPEDGLFGGVGHQLLHPFDIGTGGHAEHGSGADGDRGLLGRRKVQCQPQTHQHQGQHGQQREARACQGGGREAHGWLPWGVTGWMAVPGGRWVAPASTTRSVRVRPCAT